MIDFAQDVLGIALLPWQRWFLVHALELNPDGTFRFRTLLLLVARQNGKTTLLQVLALWRMFVDGAALVIGTAQNLDVAEEAWTGAVDMAEGSPELAAEIAHVDRTNGKKALRLETGERYKVAAASRRGGRGLSGDLVMLDELREHQSWDAWGAVTKTTMARSQAQIVCASNAGDASSVVLATLRDKALAADGAGSLGIFEYSAPDGCPMDDWDGIAQANPALGWTITAESISAALETDPEEVFRTEVLCQWVDQLRAVGVEPEDWAACCDPASAFGPGPSALGVHMTGDRATAYVAGAGRRTDGLPHVELLTPEGCRPSRIVAEVKALTGRRPGPVVVDPGSHAGSLIQDLEAAGVVVETVTLQKLAAACGSMFDAVVSRQLRHIGQQELDDAVAAATTRVVSRDAWVWSGKPVTPLIAVTLALHGAGMATESVYESRGLVTL